MYCSNFFLHNWRSVKLSTIMSHKNSSLPHRKKLPKYPPVSLHNSLNKLKKVTSGSSYVENAENGTAALEWQKLDASNSQCNTQRSKVQMNSMSRTEKFNEAIIEREIPNSNFNCKKSLTNRTKSVENSPPFQTVMANRKLEKESDLVGMLGKQLYLAESQMHRMQGLMSKADDRLKDKDQEIGRLKRKVREWEMKFKNQEIVHKKELQQEQEQVENSEYLYRRCLMLEHKIYEMEKFLADYGLVWVGDAKKDRDVSRVTNASCDYLKNCYQQLVANIEQLNMAVGKGEVHVHRDKGGCGASFKTPSCMTLKFYKNGLVVQNGHLRPYEDTSAASFIRDILDGYFPSELQKAYPQGVPFKVEDHRMETFQGPGGGFPGHGYRLGKLFHRENGSDSHTNAGKDRSGSVGLSRCSLSQRQNFYSLRPTVPPLLTSDTKTNKSNSFSNTPSSDIELLRSQILASHNNHCSDSHIQSHINAELGLSPRMAKKREVATKDAEYHISIKERTLKLNGEIGVGLRRFGSGSRTSYHSSTDRSSDRMSPGRMGSTCSEDGRSRSRSTSLPGRRIRLRSLSKTRVASGQNSTTSPKPCEYTRLNTGVKKPRATKSATLERKMVTAPLLHEINVATGRPGELRLKVRSLNGSVVYLVHLCADDTVGRLYHLLDTCIVKTRLRGYKVVVSGYAPKRLEHHDLSLREYGILGDSVLHIISDSTV